MQPVSSVKEKEIGFLKHPGTVLMVRGSDQCPPPWAPAAAQPGARSLCGSHWPRWGGGRDLSFLLSAHECRKSMAGGTRCPARLPRWQRPLPLPHGTAPQCWDHPAGRGRRGGGSALVPPELHQSTPSSSAALCNPSLSLLEISSCSEGSKLTRFGNQVSGRSLISSLNRGDQLTSCLLY